MIPLTAKDLDIETLVYVAIVVKTCRILIIRLSITKANHSETLPYSHQKLPGICSVTGAHRFGPLRPTLLQQLV